MGARCNRTSLFNIAINEIDAKKSARCNRTPCKRDLVYSITIVEAPSLHSVKCKSLNQKEIQQS